MLPAHDVHTCVPLGWKSTPLTASGCCNITTVLVIARCFEPTICTWNAIGGWHICFREIGQRRFFLSTNYNQHYCCRAVITTATTYNITCKSVMGFGLRSSSTFQIRAVASEEPVMNMSPPGAKATLHLHHIKPTFTVSSQTTWRVRVAHTCAFSLHVYARRNIV